MQRGEIWFAATPGGDRPVLVLTRDPVADSIGTIVVAALTRTRREIVSELVLTQADDDVPTECVVNFDNLHTIPRVCLPTAHHRAFSTSHDAGVSDATRCRGMLRMHH
jgi:mRNA interferase MazF